MANKILIVDDEIDIVNMLKDYFYLDGFDVITANDGEDAIEKIVQSPDIILLDVNMPKMNGLDVCRKIREHVSCPIIFLTAKIEDADIVRGFSAGGDDYVLKPFSMAELGARVTAHLRRENRNKNKFSVKFDGNLVIDYNDRTVTYQDEDISFVKKEFDIIELLSQNSGQVFGKEQMYVNIWGYEAEGDSSVIAEHVRRIRAKFLAVTEKNYIETVWGCGYKWAKWLHLSKNWLQNA